MNSKQQSPLKKLLGIRGMGAALTAFVGLIIIYIAFGIINPAVFSGQNVLNLLRSMSKYLLIGIAQSYVLITGNIDLSIGSMVGMSAMIAATLMTTGMAPILAIVIALLACLVVGVVNGNRNTDAIATGVGKETADTFQNIFYYGKTLGFYNTFWIALVIFVIFFFILSKTRTGRHIYAIGSNVDAAKLSGVNVVSTTVKTYLVSSVCSCVVGLILCAQAGMGNMEAGNMYEMYGVAAGVIGGVSPLGGTGILLGTFAGAAVWQTLENGLNMIGAQVGIQRVVIGVIVVAAVLLDVVVRNGQFGKHRKK
ncbi:ABC transporter permease [Blautia sp. Sow4_E7]|uniref:ABC transporter permease n=1 Tax=Blautia sp. Sow4_E7 TaxID=3438749 RepID=UPI003F8ED6F8